MRPNHHQFMAFAYVVREGSFSAAADRLGVTQSTITQHVSKLENRVGMQLLVRGRDGVTVTRTGQEFYDLADRLVALDTTISETLEGFAALDRGHIKIIANAPQPALRIIRDFGESFPDVLIDFGLKDWTTATAMVRDRLADVGLITDPPSSEDWVRYKVHETVYVAYMPEDHPLAARGSVSLQELADYRVILPEQGSLTEKVVMQRLRQLGITLPRTMRATTFPVIYEAVLQGIGIAIFLRQSSLMSEGIREVQIRDIQSGHSTWLVAAKDRARLRMIAEFTAVALNHA